MAIWQSKTGTWRARVRINGKDHNATFQEQQEAKEWLWATRLNTPRKNKVMPPPERYEPGTVGAVYATACEIDWANSKDRKKQGLRACRELGLTKMINEINEKELDKMVARLIEEDYAIRTIQTYISALSVILKRAVRLEYIERVPLLPDTKFMPKPEKKNICVMNDWFVTYRSALESREHVFLSEFLWHTGCRIGEALSLDWDRVNLKEKTVKFTKTKSTNARTLPISDELLNILKDLRSIRAEQGNTTSKVFWTSYNSFYNDFNTAKDYSCWFNHLGEETQKDWTIHAFRHTKLTNLAMNGVNALQLMRWAGHKTLTVSQQYINEQSIGLEGLICANV